MRERISKEIWSFEPVAFLMDSARSWPGSEAHTGRMASPARREKGSVVNLDFLPVGFRRAGGTGRASLAR